MFIFSVFPNIPLTFFYLKQFEQQQKKNVRNTFNLYKSANKTA